MDNGTHRKGLIVPERKSELTALDGDLAAKFFCPPFNVLDSKAGPWQARKKAWIALGIQSELGREGRVFGEVKFKGDSKNRWDGNPQISVFDPVLCELCYSWWCPPDGQVVDPFAGGSVRGLVASVRGLKYWGCDLNAEQIKANRLQITEHTTGEHPPKWVTGDSLERLYYAPVADFLFSCPPYGNLEVYSKQPDDISNMPYKDFLRTYQEIIREACQRLKNDRFAVFVVGVFRDKGGALHDLPGDTVRAFERAGLDFYNDAVLLTSLGTAGARCARIFVNGGRKLVPVHQRVLVFRKGNPKGQWEGCLNLLPGETLRSAGGKRSGDAG